MPRARAYSASEVETIFRVSEVLQAPSNARPGHAAARHIVLSNEELVQRYRLNDRDEQPTLVTAFALGPQAIAAVTEAMNTAIGQAALAHLDADCNEGDRVTIQLNVSPFRARYAFGAEKGMVRSATMQGLTVVLERRNGSKSFGLHLVTAFPAFVFRAGQATQGYAGWRDRHGNWFAA
jgi:hypothetical protein